jgi:hypothetical protein
VDVARISSREQCDHRTRRLVDDLLDQLECVLGAEPEPHERDVRVLARGDGAHLGDLDLARDDLVAEGGDHSGEELEAVPALVRDEDAKVRELGARHDRTILPLRDAAVLESLCES